MGTESIVGDYTPMFGQQSVGFVPFDAGGWLPMMTAPENRLVDLWAGGQRFPDHFRRGAEWFDKAGKRLHLMPTHFRFPPEPPAYVG